MKRLLTFAALLFIAIGAKLAAAQPKSGCPNPNMTCATVTSTAVNGTRGNFGFVDAGTVWAHVSAVVGESATPGTIYAPAVTGTAGTYALMMCDTLNARIGADCDAAAESKLNFYAGPGNKMWSINTVGYFVPATTSQRVYVGTTTDYIAQVSIAGVGTGMQASGHFATSGDFAIGTGGNGDGLFNRSILYRNGGTNFISDTASSVTVANSCTGEALAFGGYTGMFEFDVGTTCAGVSTTTITFPVTANNGWACSCQNRTTAGRTIYCLSGSTTTEVCSQFALTTGLAIDYTDGDNIRCLCRGG